MDSAYCVSLHKFPGDLGRGCQNGENVVDVARLVDDVERGAFQRRNFDTFRCREALVVHLNEDGENFILIETKLRE